MIFVTFLLQIRRIFLKKRSLIGSLLVLVKWFAAYLDGPTVLLDGPTKVRQGPF